MNDQTPSPKPADAEQPSGKGLDATTCCAFSIQNHLGHEVGTVETEGDPIAAYACKVNAPSSRLREAGYKSVPLHNVKGVAPLLARADVETEVEP